MRRRVVVPKRMPTPQKLLSSRASTNVVGPGAPPCRLRFRVPDWPGPPLPPMPICCWNSENTVPLCGTGGAIFCLKFGSPCVTNEPPPPPEPRVVPGVHASAPPLPPWLAVLRGPLPSPPFASREFVLGEPAPPSPPEHAPNPPAFGRYALPDVVTSGALPPLTLSVPATVKVPLTSHTIGFEPWPW